MISDFLIEELGSQPFHFPVSLQRAYSDLISDYQKKIAGFGKTSYSLKDGSQESVAWQLDRFLPTHYFKSLYSLLETELDASQGLDGCYLLSWPSITFLDIGCGSGAASLAALAILHKYQRYRAAHRAPLTPVDIQLIGVDPNPHMLEIYSRMVKFYAESIRPDLVRATVVPFEGKFPEDTKRILRLHQPENRHSVILVLSNVIRILDELYDAGDTVALEKILRLLQSTKGFSGIFGAAEGIAIESIFDEWGIDSVSVLGIATTGTDLAPNQWQYALTNLFDGLQHAISPHTFLRKVGVQKAAAKFHNPDRSYWQRKGYTQPYTNTFYYSYGRAISHAFEGDEQWRECIDEANLLLAWARARRYILVDEVLPDECEIRLFEYCLKDKLLRLRQHLLMRDWKCLNVDCFVIFPTPKKPTQTRPKTITRLEEQILSAAIVQRLGAALSRQQSRSFSHRLHPHSVEYMYEHWFYLYRRFLTETRRLAVMSKRVLRADVASFYQKIDQKILLEIIARELGTENTTQQALEAMITRDFPAEHQKGEGIPQGQIASGFWANLYLKQVDQAFEDLDGVEFARYADDMVFAIDPDNISVDLVEKQLLALLRVLGLATSDDKTFPQSSDEYREQTRFDQEIDKLAREIARLRARLFRLNQEYLDHYSNHRWEFLDTYQELLATLGIYISPTWLGRKIEQQTNAVNIFPPSTLDFPPYPSSEDDMSEWSESFRGQNIDWMLQVEDARKQLASFYLTALNILNPSAQSDKFLQELHRRRLKFAVNRLCSLGLNPIADQLALEVISRPWLVETHWVCPGLSCCGRHDLLIDILRESPSTFVRAQALRSLARHISNPEVCRSLWSVLLGDHSGFIEKLKASESLLVGDNWQEAKFDSCVSLFEAEENPYLQKNYILILGRAFQEESRAYLENLLKQQLHPIVVDAIQHALSSGFSKLLVIQEPDVLMEYYDQYYPDDESDDKSDESDPSWIPF